MINEFLFLTKRPGHIFDVNVGNHFPTFMKSITVIGAYGWACDKHLDSTGQSVNGCLQLWYLDSIGLLIYNLNWLAWAWVC